MAATRMLLKTKPDPRLPMQFLRNPTSVRPRPVSPIAQPEEAPQLQQLPLYQASTFPLLGMTHKLFAGESTLAGVWNSGFALAGGTVFARQMGTSRSSSPRGNYSRDDEDDVDEDFEDVDGRDFKDWDGESDVDESWDDEDDDDEDEGEDEMPKRKTNRGNW